MPDRGQKLYQELWLVPSTATGANIAFAGKTIATLKTALGALTGELQFDCTDGNYSLEAGGFLRIADGGFPGNNGKKLKKVELEAKIKAFQTTGENSAYTALLAMKGQKWNAYWLDDKIGVVSKGLNLKMNIKEIDDELVITGEVIGATADVWQKINMALA